MAPMEGDGGADPAAARRGIEPANEPRLSAYVPLRSYATERLTPLLLVRTLRLDPRELDLLPGWEYPPIPTYPPSPYLS